jgi:MoxR-like ATPase
MEGTFPLPEAQLDRFMMNILVDYPDRDETIEILRRIHEIEEFNVRPVTSGSEILSIMSMIKEVHVAEPILEYIVNIIEATRKHNHVKLGGSPRAAISLLVGAKANALMEGRDYVIPDDVKFVLKSVLRHRIILKPEAEFEGITTDKVIDEIARSVPVPAPGVES